MRRERRRRRAARLWRWEPPPGPVVEAWTLVLPAWRGVFLELSHPLTACSCERVEHGHPSRTADAVVVASGSYDAGRARSAVKRVLLMLSQSGSIFAPPQPCLFLRTCDRPLLRITCSHDMMRALWILPFVLGAEAFFGVRRATIRRVGRQLGAASTLPPTWEELEAKVTQPAPEPVLTLYRDTNGW